METEIEILKEVYSALNQNDIQKVLTFFDPTILRIEWEGYPSMGTFRGLEEFEAHLNQGRGTWAEGGCLPERFQVEGDKIIVYVHVKVRLKDKQDWIEGKVADAFAFKNGKIVEFRSFMKNQEALDWVGVKS